MNNASINGRWWFGGGEEVLVNFQELLDIVMKLENIYKIHLDVIGTNIESLLSCDFYQKVKR